MSHEKEKWILLGVLTLIWGSSFILIKKSLEHFNPYEVGALRILIAGIIFAPLALSNLKSFPKKNVKWLILAAFTGNFFPMFLFPIAETQVDSSIAGVINAMMPIFVVIVGALFWKTAASKRQLIGVGISFFGACILALNGADGGGMKIVPILLLLLATLCYAVSTTTIKAKLNFLPAKILSSFVFFYVLALPSLLSLLLSGFVKDFNFSRSDFAGLGYVSLLSVFGTGIAMMMNYRIINISTPLFASTVTLLMPIVAVIWGILDGEKLSTFQILGAAIIIAGLIFLRASPKVK